MLRLIFWLYLTNAVLLINHEIDSAYWHEWKLFKLPGGITGFLILHFPVLAGLLFGLVLIREGGFSGLISSLIVGLVGIFAFSIHCYFIKKGHEEFNSPISIFILVSILIISVIQLILTIILLA
jgi:hypothetical protein